MIQIRIPDLIPQEVFVKIFHFLVIFLEIGVGARHPHIGELLSLVKVNIDILVAFNRLF